jgi:hypothetical protein
MAKESEKEMRRSTGLEMHLLAQSTTWMSSEQFSAIPRESYFQKEARFHEHVGFRTFPSRMVSKSEEGSLRFV